MKKFWAKKVIKKMKGGGMSERLEKEFTEDVKLAHGGIHKPVKVTPQDVLRKKAEGGWIQSAVKKPGALRAVAAKEGLIKGKEKLSSSDLSKLGSQAKKSGNSLLAKRVSLAKTFAKMRKK